MPVLSPPAPSPALADLAAALALVDDDADARALRDAGGPDVAVDAPRAEWLYGTWWAGSRPAGGDDPLGGPLEAARRSAAPLEDGWLVLASDGVRIVCARVPRTSGAAAPGPRAAAPGGAAARPGGAARPGDLVTLYGGSGGPDPDGSWWWAHTGEPGASEPVDRWYVHARPDGAPAIVAATVALASGTGVTLSLKCPPRASGFGRRDALVVYVPRRERALLAGALPAWLAAVAPHVTDDVPPLTRRLAPGVAFAEDPGDELSYGQLRCAQVAAAVVRLRGEPGATDARRRAVLAAVGIDPDRPEVLG